MKVFPNPAKTVTTIQVEVDCKCKAEIFLYNSFGKEVYREENIVLLHPGTNEYHINCAPFSPGTYQFRLVAEKKVFTTNIVIKR
ncbi:MAG: hypothetical protein CVT92_03895 [Bacteroidetes bacterium HGW-Bacteroidetes-1]|jgi:hypothetical protein|nr:MAG: hypothetical protein CVT92_03895 [Bacteroidetes bacterium HGW-Bacteroidetes-1]